MGKRFSRKISTIQKLIVIREKQCKNHFEKIYRNRFKNNNRFWIGAYGIVFGTQGFQPLYGYISIWLKLKKNKCNFQNPRNFYKFGRKISKVRKWFIRFTERQQIIVLFDSSFYKTKVTIKHLIFPINEWIIEVKPRSCVKL